ncbi:MAG: hypothetical protein KJ077_27340 [Anaerolineae bacterium]|nr:hypothetical protein [Anaerolineae bacterium]
MTTNIQQPNLTSRARRYATVIALLFARQGLAGKLTTVHRGARHLSLGIRLADPTKLDAALKLAEPLALHAGAQAVLAHRDAGLIFYQFELAQGFWEYYTRADLPIVEAIGLAETRRPVVYSFDPPHTLVAGTSGSGKTEAIKSALAALLITNGPDSLGLSVVDPHGDYGDFHNAAHLVMPLAQEPKAFQKVLAHFVSELAHRKANNLRDGRRLVIVIDEAQEVLADGKNLILAQMLAQGRKYRMHLIIGTQKPLHGDLPKILDSLDNRFIGRVTDARVSATVTGQAGLQAHKLTGKGDFLHVTGPNVVRFQVAQATRQDFERLSRRETPVPLVKDYLADLPPILLDSAPPGRPRVELDPCILAAYWHYDPRRITYKVAAELFGLARTGHTLHRDFCLAFGQELLRLRHKKGA